MQYGRDLLSTGEPPCDLERRGLQRSQANAKRLHPAQRETAVVGGDRHPERLQGGADPLVVRRIAHGDGAEEEVAVTADVLRQRLRHDVHAVRERVEVHAGRIRVVHRHLRADAMRHFRDRRHVLDFHRDRAGTFAPDQPRLVADERLDAGTDRRGIVLARHAEATQQIVRELPVRTVDAVGDQHVLALAQQREVDEGERGLSSWHEEGAEASFELGDPARELERRRRSVQSIHPADLVLTPVVAKLRRAGEDGRRAAIDRRDERAIPLRKLDVGVNELRAPGARHGIVRRQATGRLSVNVAPDPGVLCTVTSPFMARARSRLIASPSPAPSCALVRDRPSWTNGSKIISCLSSGMPGPVSRTSIAATRPRSTHVTVTAPPSGVNFTAFDTRLSTICSVLSRSANAITGGSAAPASSRSRFRSACGLTIDITRSTTSCSGSAESSYATSPASIRL